MSVAEGGVGDEHPGRRFGNEITVVKVDHGDLVVGEDPPHEIGLLDVLEPGLMGLRMNVIHQPPSFIPSGHG